MLNYALLIIALGLSFTLVPYAILKIIFNIDDIVCKAKKRKPTLSKMTMICEIRTLKEENRHLRLQNKIMTETIAALKKEVNEYELKKYII